MDTLQNYYHLLHVLPDAPSAVIKASYRAMMQKMRHHPDLGGDPASAQILNKAVDTLCNPARRAIYDSELQALASRLEREAATTTTGKEEPTSQSRNGSCAKAENPDMAGGSPKGFEQHTQCPDEPVHSEPGQTTESAIPNIQFPARPHCLFCMASFSTAPRIRQYYLSEDQCYQCKAPAAPIEQLTTSATEELRRIYRHDYHAAVRLWTHWPVDTHVEAHLQDLSLAGCAIETEKRLHSDALVLLDTDALKAICQVRYCKSISGSALLSIGLAFKTLTIKAQPGTMFSIVA